VLLIAGGFLFVTRLEAGLEATLTSNLSARAAAISSQLRSASGDVTDSDGRGARRLPAANGIEAELLARDGTVVITSRGLGAGPLLTASQVARALHHTVILDKVVTLTSGGEAGPEPERLLARPTGRPGEVLVVAVSRDVVDKAVASAARELGLLGLVVLVLAGPGSWLLTRAALRPVEQMRRQVRGLSAGDADRKLGVPTTRDEIARLAETFNVLLAHLHGAVDRERAFVADAGHELRTPLTVLKGELELARRPGRSHEELEATLTVVAEEADRLVRLTDDMLFLTMQADSDPAHGEGINLGSVAQLAIQAVSRTAYERRVEIIFKSPAYAAVVGNPDRIRQAIENLLTNAVRHSPPNGAVTVEIRRAGADTELSVTDQGPGFPPHFIDRAFDRFTRADSARARPSELHDQLGGAGLGLAIVRAIMSTHGGSATATDNPDGGARVTLRLPAQSAAMADAPSST